MNSRLNALLSSNEIDVPPSHSLVFPSIFLSLDGVLCDFSTTAAELLDNMKLPDTSTLEYTKKYGVNRVGIMEERYIKKQVAAEALYDICSGREFWESLKPYDWSWLLFEQCFRLTQGSVYFVSNAYRQDPMSWSGKAAWCHKNFGEYGLEHLFLMVGNNREMLCSGRNDILIDDVEQNVKNWEAAGGAGLYWQEIDPRYSGAASIVASRLTQLQKLFEHQV